MYSLNLDSDNRILSICVCLEGQTYDNVVETIPDDDVINYKYVNGQYIYDPLPEPEPEPELSLMDWMDSVESSIDYLSMMTGVDIPTEV